MSGNDQDEDHERRKNDESKLNWAKSLVRMAAERARDERERNNRPSRDGYNPDHHGHRRNDDRGDRENDHRRDYERENYQHQEHHHRPEQVVRPDFNGGNRGFYHSGGFQRRENDRPGHGQRNYHGPPPEHVYGGSCAAPHNNNNNYHNGNYQGSPRAYKKSKSSFHPKHDRNPPYDRSSRGGFRGRGRGGDAPGSFSKRPGSRNYRPDGPHDQESDDSYIDDLIQFARDRLDQQEHLPFYLRLPNPEQRESTRPSSRQSGSSNTSNSRPRSRQSSRSSSKPRSRPSSRSKESKSPQPSQRGPSGWDVKGPGMEEDSESGISSNDHSDSETETFAANKVPKSDPVKSSPKSPIVDAFAAEPIDSIDVPASTIDVSLLSSTLIELVDSKESNTDFSPTASEDNFVTLSEFKESENETSNDFSPASPDNQNSALSATTEIGIEQRNNFSPASPDNQGANISVAAVTEMERSNNCSPALPDNQEAELSATAATATRPSNGFSPASPDNQFVDLSAPKNIASNDFSPASPDNNERIDILTSTKIEFSPDSPDNQEADLPETAATASSFFAPRPRNGFSPASPDNQSVGLSAPANIASNDFSPASPDNNERMDILTSIKIEFSSDSPDNQEADLPETASTGIEPRIAFSPATSGKQFVDLSASANITSNNFSPASPDNNGRIDILSSTKIETSHDFSTDSFNMQPLDLSKGKTEINVQPISSSISSSICLPIDLSVKSVSSVIRNESSNVESLSISNRSSDLSSTSTSLENSTDQANSSFGRNDAPTAAVPSVLQEWSNANNDSSTPTLQASVPEKANSKLNKKRSIHATVTRQSDNENSSAAANRPQQSDTEQGPAKKPMHSTAVPEIVTRENQISEKSATNTKTRKSTDAIVNSPKLNIKLDKHRSSKHRPKKENDIYDLFESEAVLPQLEKTVSNGKIDKKKRKFDDRKDKTNKKPKIAVKVDDANDSKNIFKKNRIKQFKVILKIMKTRSEGWTLSQLDNLDSNNFCDAIHHFESPSYGIFSLMEVKIFDSSSKANKINYKNLFGDEFNIQKYFITFCKFEHTGFSNELSKLFIYTNRDVDKALFDKNGITVTNQNRHYSFEIRKPYEQSKIYRKCLECFELPKLAELLHEFVSSSDKKPAHFNMDLMKKYHLALVNETVLVLNDEKVNGRSIRVAKFHANFINNKELSNAAQELRKHLINRHCKPTEEMQFKVGNKDFGKSTALTRFAETVDELPEENCVKTFEHFFKVFQIIRIDELEFGQAVVNGLGPEFLKLDEKIYSDAVQQELLTFLKDNGLNSNLLEPLKNTISKLKVIEKISEQSNLKLNVEFDEETFSSLLREIGTDDIILCSTESLLLSDLKMRQFSKNKSYLENEQSLFISDEILFSMTDDVVKAFNHRLTNLLVILWKNNVVTNTNHTKQIDEAMKRLRDVINKTSNIEKSVVIIAHKDNINLSVPQYQFSRIDDDLTLESQSQFFKSTTVFLQECRLKLTDLADVATIDSLIKSPKLLEKLLVEQMEIGSELVKPLGFNEKLFDFKLKQRVLINPKIFQEKIDDVFVISNINCETFFHDYKPSDRFVSVSNLQPNSYDLPSNARFILLDSQANPESVINKIRGSNVHLLSYESRKFVWKFTIGSLTNLLTFKTNDNEACNTPNTIEDILLIGPKTMLISGESGMGKSVCLYDVAKISSKLCHINSETSDPVWHVQLNLEQPLKNTLKGYPIETSENAIHFLADYLELQDEQKNLFILSAQGRLKLKLMLFVDGYDDTNENMDLMTGLLQHLQDSCIQRIFVASNNDKLERVLRTFSYSIQFGNDEKAQFVEKFDAKIDLTSKDKLLNTPLHLNMFMELIQKKPEKINIDNHYDLYKSYVNLYLPSDQLKKAYNLSAQKLLTDQELEETDTILEDVDLDLPEQLSHKTIMEYFVAKWLSKRRRQGTKNCVNNLVDRTSSIFLSSYLASRRDRKKNVSVDDYAEQGYLSFLKKMLAIDDSNKPCLRRLIRKGKNNTLEVLRFLLEHYNDTGCSDYVQSGKYVNSKLAKYVDGRVDGQTPLETAADCEKIDLACELMLKGADVSVLNSRSSFVTNAATYATNELVNGNERLGPVAAILLEKSPKVTADLDNETQLPKVLAYLFSRGHAKLVEELLKARKVSERKHLLENPVNGKSLLAHVNESRYLTDEARQSLIFYLVNNTPGDLYLNNIDSILHHACLSGHEQTFNYFMRLPKTIIGILKQALRSNDFQVIEFLMRDSKRTIDSDGNTALHQAITLKVSRKTINFLLGKVGINDKNNSGETALHLAFKEGANLSLIKFLVNAGASLTVANKQGFYPWVFAVKEETSHYCKSQQHELLTFLFHTNCLTFPNCTSINLDFDMTKKEVEPKLEYFADSNFNINFTSDGDSRLHLALPNKEEKNWCIFLINHGAEVNVEKDGKFAFHVALDNQRFDVAKLMLQHGAIIDQLDQYKNTPLEYLTSRPRDNNGEKMLDLLNFAIRIFAGGKEGQRDFNSVLNVNPDTIDYSEFRYLLNCRNKNGRTLLHLAASKSRPDIIEHLHKLSKFCESHYKDFKPMNVNAADENGDTPLHLSARQINAACAEKLLAVGAKFRTRNSDNKRPMDLSSHGSPVRKLLQAAEDLFKNVEEGKTDEVRKIWKHYPVVQYARDESGKTPLYYVKDKKMMTFLIHGVNVVDDNERPPIYYAAKENDLERVKLMLKAGANYEFKGFRDGSNKSFELLKRIDEIFEDIHSHEPKFFVEGNPWAFIKELDDILRDYGVARDIIVNTRDSQRNTLLHYAAKYNYMDVAENLLKNGAIYNSRNNYAITPEDLAYSKELFKSVNDLFANLDFNSWENVDPNLAVNCRISGGFTLLHKALEKDCFETVKWLIDHGADVRATGNNSVEVRVDRHPKIAMLLEKKL